MRIPLTNILLQIGAFALFYILAQWWVELVRSCTKPIGWDERLFPRRLVKSDQAMNEHRAKIAENILSNYTNWAGLQLENQDVEIRVVASDRGGTYLLQTVAFLLEQQPSGKFNVSICNVEGKMFEDLKKFENILPILNLNTAQKSLELNSTISKENRDYWTCLGLASQARYILLIEDDSLVVSEFSNLLQSLVRLLDNHSTVDFVKLYHPTKLRKIPSIFHTIIMSFIMSLSMCLLIYKFFSTFPILTVILLTCSLSYNISGYGSQFPSELRYQLTGSAYISYPESCCTPAVIFRASNSAEMFRYFNKSIAYQGHAKDHILDESPFVGRQSDLNYVTHIGSFSSIRHKTVYLSDMAEIRK